MELKIRLFADADPNKRVKEEKVIDSCKTSFGWSKEYTITLLNELDHQNRIYKPIPGYLAIVGDDDKNNVTS